MFRSNSVQRDEILFPTSQDAPDPSTFADEWAVPGGSLLPVAQPDQSGAQGGRTQSRSALHFLPVVRTPAAPEPFGSSWNDPNGTFLPITKRKQVGTLFSAAFNSQVDPFLPVAPQERSRGLFATADWNEHEGTLFPSQVDHEPAGNDSYLPHEIVE